MGDERFTMSREVLGVAWFRFRAGWRHRRGGYLSLVLLIGLVGGVAIGAVAAARRTQSSYPAYMRSTNPSDLHIIDLAQVTIGNHATSFQQILAGLPNVKRVASWGVPNSLELAPDDPWALSVAGGWNIEVVRSGGSFLGGLLYGASFDDGVAYFRRALSADPGNRVLIRSAHAIAGNRYSFVSASRPMAK